LILRSQEIGTSPWSNTDYTITSAIGPDGTSNAQKLVAPASSATRRMEQAVTGTAASYTLSFYAKSAGWNFVQFCSGWSGSDYVNFDLSNGIISNSSGAVGSISSVGNGWYRCSATFSALASTQGVRIIPMATSIASRFPSTTGDGVNGILVFGVQLELGSFATTYAPTTSAANAGPRFDHVYSGGQWVSKGLLVEEQRTNFLTNSALIGATGWLTSFGGGGTISTTINYATAPDGTNTASRIQLTRGVSSSYAEVYQRTTSISTGSAASVSVWLKSNLGTQIVGFAFGNSDPSNYAATLATVTTEWQRFTLSFNRATSNPVGVGVNLITWDSLPGTSTNVDILAWGAQTEAGSFPTSYIGTTTSSVTRSADVCQITGTSFNWMWNQGEGSVVAEYDRLAVKSSEQQVFNASTSSGGQQINYSLHPSDDYALFWTGSIQAKLQAGAAIQAGIVGKNAIAYKVNDFAMSFNGGAIVSDNAGTVPIPDRIGVGSDLSAGSYYINGHIAKLLYYPARLTNTKLQQLST